VAISARWRERVLRVLVGFSGRAEIRLRLARHEATIKPSRSFREARVVRDKRIPSRLAALSQDR